MSRDDFIILAVAALCDGAWALSLWRRWPEQCYERMKDRRAPWLWLSVFRIERSERNCVRFLRGSCIAGMIVMTVMSLVVVSLGHCR